MIVVRAKSAKHSEAVYEKPYWYRDAVGIRVCFLSSCGDHIENQKNSYQRAPNIILREARKRTKIAVTGIMVVM